MAEELPSKLTKISGRSNCPFVPEGSIVPVQDFLSQRVFEETLNGPPSGRLVSFSIFSTSLMAFLCGRLDLLERESIENTERNLAPDPELLICPAPGRPAPLHRGSLSGGSQSSMGTTSFREEPVRAGRNDLCPCGSGKKYKRCCIDGAPLAAARWPAQPPGRWKDLGGCTTV